MVGLRNTWNYIADCGRKLIWFSQVLVIALVRRSGNLAFSTVIKIPIIMDGYKTFQRVPFRRTLQCYAHGLRHASQASFTS